MNERQPEPASDNEDTSEIKRRIRRNHPLVKRMQEIRKRHGVALVEVEGCMQIPYQTLRQIEEGRRPLPPLISNTGTMFSEWFASWLRCVGCSDAERFELEDLLMHIVLGRSSRLLPS